MLLSDSEIQCKSSNFKSSINDIIEEIRGIKCENSQHKWKVNELLCEVADLKCRNSELEKIAAECEKQLNKAQELQREANIKIERQAENISRLSAKYSTLRAKKKKLNKLIKQQLETNTILEKDVEAYKALKYQISSKEQESLRLSIEIERKNSEIADEKRHTQSIQSVLHDMEMRNMKMAEQFKQIQKTQIILNKSINDLENINKTKEQRIKEFKEQIKNKQEALDKSTAKYQSLVRRIGQDLEMTRCELVERRREVSQLKQENLLKDFTFQETTQTLIKIGVKIKGNDEENLRL